MNQTAPFRYGMIIQLIFILWVSCHQNSGPQAPQGTIRSAPAAPAPLVDESDIWRGLAPEEQLSGQKKFLVAARESHIQKFPCKGCHPGSSPGGIPHSDIPKGHPGGMANGCKTCHSPVTGELQSMSGKKLSFDHAYLICARCHSGEAKDWQGGAHGKRLSHWGDQRVIASCTHCHNPHKPGLPKRRPVALITGK